MELIRVHYNEKNIIENLSDKLSKIIVKDLVIVCIGTDKVIFDSVGPFIGTYLSNNNLEKIHIYGTLKNTINARNLDYELFKIKIKHPKSTILAIDACFGKVKDIGDIVVSNTPVYPGKGVKNNLQPVGDYSVRIVTANKCDDTVRLNFIVDLSEIISKSILKAINNYNLRKL